MPLATTKRAAQAVHQRLRRATEEVRRGWTGKDELLRRLEAHRMQGRLVHALAPVPVRR